MYKRCMFFISSGVVEPLPAALVRPDTTHQYEWVVPKGGGPTEKDPDCITYLYYSAVDPIRDTNSGLVGPLLICKPKTLKSGKQVGEMDAEWAKICKMCWDESTAGVEMWKTLWFEFQQYCVTILCSQLCQYLFSIPEKRGERVSHSCNCVWWESELVFGWQHQQMCETAQIYK